MEEDGGHKGASGRIFLPEAQERAYDEGNGDGSSCHRQVVLCKGAGGGTKEG